VVVKSVLESNYESQQHNQRYMSIISGFIWSTEW